MSDESAVEVVQCWNCGAEADSLDDLVPVEGEGERSPRHICEECDDMGIFKTEASA